MSKIQKEMTKLKNWTDDKNQLSWRNVYESPNDFETIPKISAMKQEFVWSPAFFYSVKPTYIIFR